MTCYAGFDAAVFPGTETLAWLRSHSNMTWCGYYLSPAPNLAPAAATWKGQRSALDAGWGLVPIYVGQQLPRHATTGLAANQFSSILTTEQGRTDGRQAAALAIDEGFPRGAHLYVDWEDGGTLTAESQHYLAAWLGTVSALGFGPGVYCSHLLAVQVERLLLTTGNGVPGRIWCFRVSSTNLHRLAVPLTKLSTKDPAGSGYPNAVSWQYEQNAWFERPDTHHRIVADFNSSTLADPGRPGPAQHASGRV